MKKIILPKADPIVSGEDVESFTIEISAKIKQISALKIDLKELEEYYDSKADILVDALSSSLPQGIMEPLIVKLMQRRISLYCGLMKGHKTESTEYKDEALTILSLKLGMSGEQLEELVELCKLPLSERFKKMGIEKIIKEKTDD